MINFIKKHPIITIPSLVCVYWLSFFSAYSNPHKRRNNGQASKRFAGRETIEDIYARIEVLERRVNKMMSHDVER